MIAQLHLCGSTLFYYEPLIKLRQPSVRMTFAYLFINNGAKTQKSICGTGCCTVLLVPTSYVILYHPRQTTDSKKVLIKIMTIATTSTVRMYDRASCTLQNKKKITHPTVYGYDPDTPAHGFPFGSSFLVCKSKTEAITTAEAFKRLFIPKCESKQPCGLCGQLLDTLFHLQYHQLKDCQVPNDRIPEMHTWDFACGTVIQTKYVEMFDR